MATRPGMYCVQCEQHVEQSSARHSPDAYHCPHCGNPIRPRAGGVYEQRTFLPDDDSAAKANWPTPPQSERTLTDWVPGTIILIMFVIVGVAGLIEVL